MKMSKKTKNKIKKFFSKKKTDNRVIYGIVGTLLVVGIAVLLGCSFDEKWVQKGDIVSKGNEKYLIGDYYYNYDETINGERNDVVDVNWKVLGVDEDGHLLIVSASNAWNLTLGSEDDIFESQDDFVTGVSQINEICRRYGYGVGAVGGRSIVYNDIIDVFDVEKKYLGNLYDEFTYYWGSNGNVISVDSDGSSKSTDIYKNEHFLWFNEKQNKWKISAYGDEFTNENMGEIVSMSDKLKYLNSLTYDVDLMDYVEIFKGNEKKNSMLFKDELGEDASYWTGDRYIHAAPGYIAYGFNNVKGNNVNYNHIIYSLGKTREFKFGVRPVVMIK